MIDHKIISNASCTTNCLAPVADILNNTIGIESGHMTTMYIHILVIKELLILFIAPI